VTHSRCVDYEQITALVVLQQLDRAPRHIRQTWFVAPVFAGLRSGDLAFSERPEKFCPAPYWDRLQLGTIAHDVETIAPQFQEQVAIFLSSAVFGLGKKLCLARTKSDVD